MGTPARCGVMSDHNDESQVNPSLLNPETEVLPCVADTAHCELICSW